MIEVILIMIVVLLSRLPFLWAGFGDDPDAWRVAITARTLATTGTYVPSRLPGYPFQEMVYALLWPGSPFTFNLLTAIFSVGAVLFFALSLRRLGCRDAGLACLALAFTPIVFINSTNSMDYVWALAFLMASLYHVLGRRPLVAGVLLGLAIGCRITSGAMLLPLSLMVVRPGEQRSRPVLILTLASVACLVGAACFSPVFAAYGPGFFRFAEASSFPAASEMIARLSVDFWGSIGSIALLAALGTLIFRSGASLQARSIEAMQPLDRTACGIAIALYIIAFLRLPVEASYLIPAIPFVLILLAFHLARPIFQVVCLALLITSFVSVSNADTYQGLIYNDRTRRIVSTQEVERIVWLGSRLREKSVAVVGPLLPQIEFTTFGTPSRTIYVYGLDSAQARAYQAEGYRIYYTHGLREYNQLIHGIDLEQFGATQLRPTNRRSDEME